MPWGSSRGCWSSAGLGPVNWSEKWMVSMCSGNLRNMERILASSMAEATSATSDMMK